MKSSRASIWAGGIAAAVIRPVCITAAGAAIALASPAAPCLAQTGPQSPGDDRPQIFIASDSTAQTYEEFFYPQTGWGQMLECAFDDDVVIRNRAMGGRSTKTFVEEGRWDQIIADVREGDVVLIQFGHNDAAEAFPSRYAPARGLYHDSLLRFIWQARGRGAAPVLVTPIAQREYDEKGRARITMPEYSAVVRELGQSEHVPVIDLETLGRAWIDAAGPDLSKTYYLHLGPNPASKSFPLGIDDNTHLSELGARGAANLVARAYRTLHLPHWASVNVDAPALTRTTPLGRRGCS